MLEICASADGLVDFSLENTSTHFHCQIIRDWGDPVSLWNDCLPLFVWFLFKPLQNIYKLNSKKSPLLYVNCRLPWRTRDGAAQAGVYATASMARWTRLPRSVRIPPEKSTTHKSGGAHRVRRYNPVRSRATPPGDSVNSGFTDWTNGDKLTLFRAENLRGSV